ncbi:alcohol dehydrogenase catalytic domain-containing protein [Tsukamurella soli]|uniref:NAD(P)-dependent alcohol dehydrogenase n=1 Tax=Tsukamurella soli TaxID=644556 RepID=A0ABP8K738_9ACTN
MRAVKLSGPGTLTLEDVPIPEPGPGQVRIKVTSAGLCQSDLHVLHMKDWPVRNMTMGHEGAGIIDAVAPDVSGPAVGDPVIVDLIWSCGQCRPYVEGRGNACAVAGSRTAFPTTPGLGPNGAMADYQVVPARQTLPLQGLDPATAAPLGDAGVTPMHAINTVRDRLIAGATVVVIGVGGLGHLGVQILAATTGARIVALDTDPAKVAAAAGHGAHLALPSGADAAARILAETDGYGADVVLDFVGVQPTIDLAAATVAPEGAVRLVGLGGGRFPMSAVGDGTVLPWGVNVQRSYGGTRTDLLQVLALARGGRLRVDTVAYPLDEFQRAFDDLAAGRLSGRAVLIP